MNLEAHKVTFGAGLLLLLGSACSIEREERGTDNAPQVRDSGTDTGDGDARTRNGADATADAPEIDAESPPSIPDAKSPPAPCVLPCVWEILKDCLPPTPATCTTESWAWTVQLGVPQNWGEGTTTTACGENSRWVREQYSHHYGDGTLTRYYAGDSLCLSHQVARSNSGSVDEWTDGDGRIIAIGSTSDFSRPAPPAECVTPDGSPRLDDSGVHVVDASDSGDAATPYASGQDAGACVPVSVLDANVSGCTSGTCVDPDPMVSYERL